MSDTKECIVCGGSFERAHGTGDTIWAQRTCCSKACGSRLPRLDRYPDLPETKACEVCGKEFARPASYHGQQWALRKYCSQACNGRAKSQRAWATWPEHTCPICGERFRRAASQTAKGLVTCGNQDCQRTYKRTVAAAKISAAHTAAYASGKRSPVKGVSPRELALWPELRERGWQWQTRWFELELDSVEMDFALVDQKLNVEIDGEEHRWAPRRERDPIRDAALTARGWRILRIANEDVDADPAAVIARVLAFAA